MADITGILDNPLQIILVRSRVDNSLGLGLDGPGIHRGVLAGFCFDWSPVRGRISILGLAFTSGLCVSGADLGRSRARASSADQATCYQRMLVGFIYNDNFVFVDSRTSSVTRGSAYILEIVRTIK